MMRGDIPEGVQYQVYLFRRDYQNGLAISDRYLALINSPEYLTADSRDKRKRSLEPKRKQRQRPVDTKSIKATTSKH
jgi:hypothetical protein